jgi:hypothetical protein
MPYYLFSYFPVATTCHKVKTYPLHRHVAKCHDMSPNATIMPHPPLTSCGNGKSRLAQMPVSKPHSLLTLKNPYTGLTTERAADDPLR